MEVKGKQTAIQAVTQSTDSQVPRGSAPVDQDVNETWDSGPERTLFWLCHYLAPEGTRVLDAGCGTGLVAVALSEGGFVLRRIDYSTAMLAEVAKNVYQQLQQVNMNTALPITRKAYDGGPVRHLYL